MHQVIILSCTIYNRPKDQRMHFDSASNKAYWGQSQKI